MPTYRALVVDDSPTMRKSLMFALQRVPGMTCVEAENGADALVKLGTGPFHLILTDINMPVMDGLKLIAALRREPATAALPLVVISTDAASEDRSRAMDLGANAYLVKPVQAVQVVDTAKKLLKIP